MANGTYSSLWGGASMPTQPVPVPTPYQAPQYGGSPYVTPGYTGQAISAQDYPIGTKAATGETLWASGKVTGAGAGAGAGVVRGATTPAPTTPTPTTPGAPAAPAASLSDQQKAAEVLRLMNAGQITWDDNLRAWANNILSGGGVPDPYAAAIEQMFAPTASYLESLEKSYQEKLPLAEEQLKTSYEEALIPVEERQATQQALIGKQQQDVETQRQSALAQSRQLYNEMVQNIVSRFGAGVSTGPAAMELLGRQAYGQISGVQQTAEKALSALTDETKRLADFAGRQKEVLATKKQQALEGLRQEFRDKLLAVQGMRAASEVEKAKARLGAMQEYRDRAWAIQDADTTYQQQLALFEQTKQSQLAQTFSANTGIGPEASLTFTRLIASGKGFLPEQAARITGIDLSQYLTPGMSPSELFYPPAEEEEGVTPESFGAYPGGG